MYKLTYIGEICSIFISKLLEKEQYASLVEAEKNKMITCYLLQIPSNQIKIEKKL